MFGILVSFLDGLFSGAMLVLGRVGEEYFHHGTTYYVQEQEKALQMLMSLYSLNLKQIPRYLWYDKSAYNCNKPYIPRRGS